jgi:hypothetical protein
MNNSSWLTCQDAYSYPSEVPSYAAYPKHAFERHRMCGCGEGDFYMVLTVG